MATAGWYPDPGNPSGEVLRWYDGAAWTGHVRAAAAAPHQPAPVPAPSPQQAWAPTQRGAPPQQAWAPSQHGAPRQHGTGQPPPAHSSMATSRKVLFGVVLLFVVGNLTRLGLTSGLSWVLWTVWGTLLAVAAGYAVWLPRRRRLQVQLTAEARRSGLLDGALWSGVAMRTPTDLLGLNLSDYASGLLVVRPGQVAFLLGERAVRNGHRPWQPPTAGLDTEVIRLGSNTHCYLRSPQQPLELQVHFGSKGLREALRQSGAAVR